MAAKHKRERQNFEKASQVRETVIKNLNECQSYERLQVILHHLQEAKKKSQSPFRIRNLNDYHIQAVNSLDKQLDRLIQEKKNRFPKPIEPVSIIAEGTQTETLEELVDTNLSVQVEVQADADELTQDEALVDSIYDVRDESTTPYSGEYSSGYEYPAPVEGSTRKANWARSNDRIYMPLRRTSDEFNHGRAQELWEIRDKLNILKIKGKTFLKYSDKDDATYKSAAKAVAVIYRNINLLCSDYEYGRINLKTFKIQCKKYLKDENQDVVVANTHRQYKDAIANLLIALTGIGFLAMAAVSVYNGHFTLFKVTTTDAGNKVDALRDSIASVRVR